MVNFIMSIVIRIGIQLAFIHCLWILEVYCCINVLYKLKQYITYQNYSYRAKFYTHFLTSIYLSKM